MFFQVHVSVQTQQTGECEGRVGVCERTSALRSGWSLYQRQNPRHGGWWGNEISQFTISATTNLVPLFMLQQCAYLVNLHYNMRPVPLYFNVLIFNRLSTCITGSKPLVCHGPDVDFGWRSERCLGPGSSLAEVWVSADSRRNRWVPVGHGDFAPGNEKEQY